VRHILSTVPDEPAPERVLFVHAHPDDETIATGGTIATLVDRGGIVTVLTCTRGELGEVIPEDIRQLEGSKRLAAYRARELAAAMGILGVRDHRFLGDPGARWGTLPPRRYTDSGMRWGASGAEATETFPEGSLCAAPFGDVAADIAAVIEATSPSAVVSYDARGGYGHPDHIRAREAALRAAEVMDVPFFSIEADGDIEVEVSAVLERKTAALRAYRSQVTVDGDHYALSSGPARPIATVERFARVRDDRPRAADQGFAVLVLSCVLALVIGAGVGGIATVEHQFAVRLFGVSLPVGIVATLVIAVALFSGCRLAFERRLSGIFAAIGTIGTIGVLSLASAGGGLLVPANPVGYLLVYGVPAVAIVTLAWPARGIFRRDRLGVPAIRREPEAP
jgi:N-acetyl-1-D-myo-inositol-2-amino-2-deoxy-alpha-D-glucopyranoside deacetylase